MNFAVSDQSGQLEFHKQTASNVNLPAELLPNNSLRTKPTVSSLAVAVEAITVDEYLANHPGSNILRIDVEGLCYEVLKGAEASLSQSRLIYAEVEDYEIWKGQKTVFDVYDLLDEYGFIPLTRDIQTPGQYNVLFAREKDAFSRSFRGQIALYHRRLSILNERSQNTLGL